MVGKRTQITLILTAAFQIINGFFPDMLSPEVQQAIMTLLLTVAGVFFAEKVSNK